MDDEQQNRVCARKPDNSNRYKDYSKLVNIRICENNCEKEGYDPQQGKVNAA